MKLIELAEELEWMKLCNLKELDVQLGRFTVKLEGVIVQLKGACCAIGRSMQRNWMLEGTFSEMEGAWSVFEGAHCAT